MAGGKTILIIDDEADLRFTLADILRALGHVVRVAPGAREGLENIRTLGAPAVIVLDLMMPFMDGYQFVEELQRDPALSKIPVIIATAEVDFRKEELHPFGIVKKPVKLPVLCALIEKALGEGAGGGQGA